MARPMKDAIFRDLVLCRSDQGDGGWSLHAPDSTDEAIAAGDAPPLLTGTARWIGGAWSRPTHSDITRATVAYYRRLA